MLEYVAGPLVGAVIGYFTNYLAVKMLFRPYREIRIGKFVLPFTPGVLPKRKKKFGEAIGTVIQEQLITRSDIEDFLLSEQMVNHISEEVFHWIPIQKENEEQGEILCEKISSVLAMGLKKAEVGTLVEGEIQKVILQKISGSFFERFITPEFIAEATGEIGKILNEYIEQNGEQLVKEKVDEEVKKADGKTLSVLLEEFSINPVVAQVALEDFYKKTVREQLDAIIEKLDLSQIVQEKIDAMDMPAIEKLVLSVMKSELNAVVSLGAVIGFLIGIINIFI